MIDPINLVMLLAHMNTALEISGRLGEGGGHVHSLSSVTALEWLVHDVCMFTPTLCMVLCKPENM